MKVVQHIERHGLLGFEEGVIALVEVVLGLLDILLRGEAEGASPEAVSFTVGHVEQVLLASDSVEGEEEGFGLFFGGRHCILI